MRRLASRLDAIKLFENEYETALNLQEGPANPTKKDKQDHEELKRCLAESLAKNFGEGLLQIVDGDDELLIQTARSRGESFVSGNVLPLSKLVMRNVDFIVGICSKLSEEASQEWLSVALVRSFTSDIVDLLVHEIRNHCALQAANESKTACFQPTQFSDHSMSYFISTDSYHRRLSWRALSALFCLCEKLELHDPVPRLLQPIFEIARSAGVGDHTEFLIPLLQSLFDDLAESRHSLQHYRSLYREILQSIIKDYVGLKPSPPEDWSRDRKNDRCYHDRIQGICDDCSALNEFLSAPDRSEWRFQAAEKRRKHIDHRRYGLDLKTSLERSEKPFTLILSKTEESYRKALHDWHGKRRTLTSTLDYIGPEKLKMMLADHHGPFMKLYSDVASGEGDSCARQPLEPLGEPQQNRKRGRESPEDALPSKRVKEVQIIDLSEE